MSRGSVDGQSGPAGDNSEARRRARETVLNGQFAPRVLPSRGVVERFIDTNDDALLRSNTVGHLTGSALVVDAAGERMILLHHTKLQRWLQPGGHADGDGDLARVALREATEETGIEGLQVDPVAIDVDIHEVAPPDDGPHLHLDVRFLVEAPPGAEPAGNHESTAIRWVRFEELDDYEPDDGLRRLAEQARRRLGERRR